MYKLGQLESMLAGITIEMSKQTSQFDKDFTRFETRFDTLEKALKGFDKRVERLEDLWDAARNWLVGGGFVVSILFLVVKAVLPWVLK